jgi:hypothetical protein
LLKLLVLRTVAATGRTGDDDRELSHDGRQEGLGEA